MKLDDLIGLKRCPECNSSLEWESALSDRGVECKGTECVCGFRLSFKRSRDPSIRSNWGKPFAADGNLIVP